MAGVVRGAQDADHNRAVTLPLPAVFLYVPYSTWEPDRRSEAALPIDEDHGRHRDPRFATLRPSSVHDARVAGARDGTSFPTGLHLCPTEGRRADKKEGFSR